MSRAGWGRLTRGTVSGSVVSNAGTGAIAGGLTSGRRRAREQMGRFDEQVSERLPVAVAIRADVPVDARSCRPRPPRPATPAFVSTQDGTNANGHRGDPRSVSPPIGRRRELGS